MEIDTTIFNQGALVAFGLVFLGGVVTSIGPCNVAMIPLETKISALLSLTNLHGIRMTFVTKPVTNDQIYFKSY